MTPLVWTGAFALVGLVAAALTATYDQTQRRLDRETVCGCPLHDAGGSCAEDGAA